MNAISDAFAEIVSLFFDDSVLAIGLILLMVGCFLGEDLRILTSPEAVVLLVGGAIGLLLLDLLIEVRRAGRSPAP